MKKVFFLIAALFVFGQLVHAQERITGTVVDEEGRPIVGANVMVQGTTMGTITDIDGHFELPAGKDAALEFTVPYYWSPKIDYSAHRCIIWADGAFTTPYDVWGRRDNGERSGMGGGAGFGYQLFRHNFLFTIGVEFQSLNYHKYFYGYKDKDDTRQDLRKTMSVNTGFVQMPIMLGFEIPHFYWQAGAKVGTALYNQYDKSAIENKYLRLAPTMEFGVNFDTGSSAAKAQKMQERKADYREAQGMSYKVGIIAESGFDFVRGTSDDFFNLFFGLKLSVSFHDGLKTNEHPAEKVIYDKKKKKLKADKKSVKK